MKKGKAIAFASLGTLLVLLLVISQLRAPAKKLTNTAQAKVTKGNIEVSVSGTGSLLPIKEQEITSSASGTVDKIYVKNGDIVEKGDIIAKLTNGRKIKAPIDGLVTGLNISQDEEIGNQLSVKQPDVSNKLIPMQNLQSQESPSTASPKTFGKVIDTAKMKVIYPVDEVDILKVKVGEEASVTVDALPDKNYQGKVTEIAQEGVVQNNVSTFDVTIEIDNPGNILKSGMTCNVDVVAQQKNNVLLIPIEALQQSGQQKYVVVPTPDAKSKKKTVQVGLTNESYAEITKGLTNGETILLPSLVEEDKKTGMGPFGRR